MVEVEKVKAIERECNNLRTDNMHLAAQNQRLQRHVEEVDNKNRRNNLCLKGLKEGEEEGDLKKYLETLLTGCLASDTEAIVSLAFAHRVGHYEKGQNKNRDQDVILGFVDGGMKSLVLDSLWGKPKLVVAKQQLTFYSDLFPHPSEEKGMAFTDLKTYSP